MTRYDTGRRLEYKAKKELEALGYTVVRSAGSKGPFDLVAIGENDIRLIQVKKATASKGERGKMGDILAPRCCRKELWERLPHGWKVTRL